MYNTYISIENNVVKLDDEILDDKKRKIISNTLISKIPKLEYRFNKGIEISKDEKLMICVVDTFKNTYNNVMLCNYNGIEIGWYLMEGCRYLSLEEQHHIIDLIYPQNTTFYMEVDLK